jgi:hypothetical protein
MNLMTDTEAKELIKTVFEKIRLSRTINELVIIEKNPLMPPKNRINEDKYLEIDFHITQEEIDGMIGEKLIKKDFQFTEDVSRKIKDPLAKLLFALAWKNGDLKKIRHIIQGVVEAKSTSSTKKDALVFYQFGKYLTKSIGEPLIDQHVIRAFMAYNYIENTEKFTKIRSFNTIGKKHIDIIEDYKHWLSSDKLTIELRKLPGYAYYIDKILFAAGKTIKIK